MRPTSLGRWFLSAAILWACATLDAVARESVEYVLRPDAIVKVWIDESDPRLQGKVVFSVVVQLSEAEKAKLALLTRENVEKELRIVWDGQVLFTPIIREEVRSGRLEIPHGNREEAEALARRLRTAPGSQSGPSSSNPIGPNPRLQRTALRAAAEAVVWSEPDGQTPAYSTAG